MKKIKEFVIEYFFMILFVIFMISLAYLFLTVFCSGHSGYLECLGIVKKQHCIYGGECQ